MRIDKFLKVSRILKRRTVAQEAADAGKGIAHLKAPHRRAGGGGRGEDQRQRQAGQAFLPLETG